MTRTDLRPTRCGAGLFALLLGLASGAAVAQAHSDPAGHTTLEQEIVGGDPTEGYQTLRVGPGTGEYVVRDELAEAKPGRAKRRRSLVYLGQITDFQLADEESPARAEDFDSEPFWRFASSGFRPQEAMVIHEIELTVRQLNNFYRSPVQQGNGRRARMLNAVMTGDLADNMQRNETQWVAELLEGSDRYPGGNPLKPDPDVRDPLDPNSGTDDLRGTACNESTPLDDPRNYTGVQDHDDYLTDAPLFYDPENPRGVYEARGFPTYPGLLDRAQLPFHAEGLRVPSYVAFGNHDSLFQGTVSAQAVVTVPGVGHLPFDRIAVNCLKPRYPVQDLQSGPAFATVEQLERMVQTHPERVMQVPPDKNRQFVDKHQFKNLFRIGAQRDDHGFAYVDPVERIASNDQASYYSFSPKPGVRYIVLDTVSESGTLVSPADPRSDLPVTSGAEGNIDHPQWRWLRRELGKARMADELTVVFGHHNVKTLDNTVADEAAPCTPPAMLTVAPLFLPPIEDEHGHDAANPSCDRDPRLSAPLHFGDDLIPLLHRHPEVIAYVGGHTHENEINLFEDEDGDGGYWEITSPAIADWPPQHRLIEVMDNRDGTLSIFATVLDHEGRVKAPPSRTPASKLNLRKLGAIGRTLDYNDPQEGPDPEKIGEPTDRNVELIVPDPR